MRTINRRLLIGLVLLAIFSGAVSGVTVVLSETAQTPAHDSSSGSLNEGERGVQIGLSDYPPNTQQVSLTVTLSDDVNGYGPIDTATTVYLRHYNGTLVDTEPIDSQKNITFNGDYPEGKYLVTVDDPNNGHQWTRYLSPNLPYTSENGRVRINASVVNGDIYDGEPYNVRKVTVEITSDVNKPTLSDPQPTGGRLIENSPVELSIDISDPDFGTSEGDELTVTFYDESDGSELGTQTITQNQTVNETFDNPVSGTNEWSVRVEDSYGNVVESETFSFQTPEVLELRNESAPNTLVTEESDIEVRFFGRESGEVITRTATNGTVDMTGLPVDEPLIASTDVDGYFQRSIAIDSILEQQRMFLLPESADASQVDWVLDDNSGRFDPGETTLFIERPIEIDGTTKYRVIYGEQFGGTGRTASTLATGDRYRLRVENQDGNTRLLGSYLAAGAAQETLTVGSVDFPGLDDTGTAFSAVLNDEDGVIDYRFADDSAETDELTVEIYKNGELVRNSTLSGPVQTVREQVPLSDLNHSEGDSYRIEYSADRNGIVIDGERIVGDVPELADDWNIDAGLLNILGMITIVASFGGVVILSPRHAGIVAFSVAFALSIIGVVAINQVLIGLGFVASGLFAAAGGNP
ncbi:hypothetical protein HPS36_02090 [Halorubrum salinarum]|uniref:Uncharacterized protein n=1 Tax=Halorubrum salinarum TaxID=2739057 RepID=A0A7D3Y087_9EURY|nr:hypothetical protein [Halorubrum salinarum]QKG91693.1 hypothetical protein HPS36_02090 [Halorubrum salinarum]